MRATFVKAGLATILLLVAGCKNNSSNSYGSAPTSPSPVTVPPNTVIMANMAFDPPTITVAKNTTVTWTNNDRDTHNSTSDSGVWATGDIAPGSSKTTTFTTTGTFAYTCTLHPMMKGTVIVQ